MKTAVIAGGWALSVVGAFLVGSVTSDDAPERTGDADAEVDRLRGEVADLTGQLEQSADQRERADGGGRVRHAVSDTSKRAASTAAAARNAESDDEGEDVPTFTLATATSGAEASREFMAFAEVQLARGEAGHVAIMDAIADIWTNREMMEKLFGDETQAVRELYPWIKFLVHHEEEVVGLSDYVFRTMAEDPMAFEKLPDDDILEMFTEGVAIILPGVIDEERLSVFRGYARQILETPKNEQPKAVSGNRNEIERLLARFWAAPIDPMEALAQLKAGTVPVEQISRMLQLVPPEMLGELDVTALIVPLLKSGDRNVLRVLRGNPNLRIEVWKTDQAVGEGLATGKVTAWFLQSYFAAVGHKKWTDVRPFFDRALAAGGKSLAAAVQALSGHLRNDLKPDKAYIEDVLSRFRIDEGMATRLKAVYGIE